MQPTFDFASCALCVLSAVETDVLLPRAVLARQLLLLREGEDAQPLLLVISTPSV